jgi:hypothetical protein
MEMQTSFQATAVPDASTEVIPSVLSNVEMPSRRSVQSHSARCRGRIKQNLHQLPAPNPSLPLTLIASSTDRVVSRNDSCPAIRATCTLRMGEG